MQVKEDFIMKSGLKKALVALLVLDIVFFLGYVAMFVVMGFTVPLSGNSKAEIVKFLTNHFTPVGQIFLFKGGEMWQSIVAISLAAVTLVLIVLGAVYVGQKKHGRLAWFSIMLVLVLVPALDILANYKAYLGGIKYDSTIYNVAKSQQVFLLIYVTALLVCAGLSFILTYIEYGLGLRYAGTKSPVVDENTVTDGENEFVMNDSSEDIVGENIIQDPVPSYAPSIQIEPEPLPDESLKDEALEGKPAAVKEEVKPEPKPASVGEEKVATAPAQPVIDQNALASMIREVVRDIVRDELARNELNRPQPQPKAGTETHSVVGATFGGPLVVQYFNGGINSPCPAPQPVVSPSPVVEEKPAPAPVVEEKPQPKPVEEKKEEVVKPSTAPSPVNKAPVVEEKVIAPTPVVEAPSEEAPKAPIIRIPFTDRILGADKEMKDNYNELKNEILSWGVKSRVSNSGDTFRLHRKTYIKLTIAGKSLKLYFALDPNEYKESTIPVQDAGDKAVYAEIPLIFKVKSPLSLRRAKQLIQDVMEKDGLEQGEVGTVNWVKEIKASLNESK